MIFSIIGLKFILLETQLNESDFFEMKKLYLFDNLVLWLIISQF